MRSFAAVLLCIALAGCQAKKSASLHIDPALESLVPTDTVAVAGANLNAVRATPVYQKLLARFRVPQVENFKDQSQVLFCWDGKRGLYLARGTFRTADLPRLTYKNRSMFGTEQNAILQFNDSIVIAGPAAELRSIIDNKAAGGLPPALADLLRTLPASDQIYAALTGGLEELKLPVPRAGNLGNVIEALRSVDTAVLGMDLTNGLSLLARTNSKTERDAKFVHDMLKGLVGFGRLNTPDNQPELLKLYDAIHIDQQQNQTQVTADIPADQVDRFLDLLPKR
jgi:hypothetical protein